MSLALLKPFVAVLTGTSETEGRLAGFPDTLLARLKREIRLQPEAIGPVIIHSFGHGGWTSTDILAEAPAVAVRRPNFILAETGDINCAFDSGGGPAVTRSQKTLDQLAMAAAWQVNNPGVDIVFRTANPVGASIVSSRPTLPDFYADTLNTAVTHGFGSLDNASAWPSPLPEWMTFGFDGLHPVWANAVEIYEYRDILFLFRQKMAAWWGLAAPVAPVYPAAPDIDYLLIGGGGGGGDTAGGGGGAGGVLRGRDYLAALLGPFSIGAAGAAAAGGSHTQGTKGGDTTVGLYKAIGGGPGGGNAISADSSRGGDGGSSGGAGGSGSAEGPGVPRLGQGFQGGPNDTVDGGAGGGGGCMGPGAPGTVDGGPGGPGWTDDVPGDVQPIAGGAPGGSFSGVRPAYPLGGGPAHFGGGGRGGTSGSPNADPGGIGKAYIWYTGAPRFAGGTITTVGGVTVHSLTGTGTLA